MKMNKLEKMVAVSKAAKSFLLRQQGTEVPEGKMSYGWKWYPRQKEKCNLCGGIASPSIAWPDTLWDQCRIETEYLSEMPEFLGGFFNKNSGRAGAENHRKAGQ
jgi:hypothetical protein